MDIHSHLLRFYTVYLFVVWEEATDNWSLGHSFFEFVFIFTKNVWSFDPKHAQPKYPNKRQRQNKKTNFFFFHKIIFVVLFLESTKKEKKRNSIWLIECNFKLWTEKNTNLEHRILIRFVSKIIYYSFFSLMFFIYRIDFFLSFFVVIAVAGIKIKQIMKCLLSC